MNDMQKAREKVVEIFNDSAAMEGNERAFLEALRAYEDVLLLDKIEILLELRMKIADRTVVIRANIIVEKELRRMLTSGEARYKEES
jgi:hypothetical protein